MAKTRPTSNETVLLPNLLSASRQQQTTSANSGVEKHARLHVSSRSKALCHDSQGVEHVPSNSSNSVNFSETTKLEDSGSKHHHLGSRTRLRSVWEPLLTEPSLNNLSYAISGTLGFRVS